MNYGKASGWLLASARPMLARNVADFWSGGACDPARDEALKRF